VASRGRPRETAEPSTTRQLGVRAFLFVILCVTSALPVALLGMNHASRLVKDRVEAVDKQLAASGQATADQITLMMLDSVHAAESFADEVAARRSLSFDALSSALRAHTLHHPHLIGAYIADARGDALIYRTVQGELAPGNKINYADRDYFQEVVKTQRALISHALMGRFTHTWAINVVAPIHDEQKQFLGITCSSVDLRGISERARRAISALNDGRIVVLDAEGRVLADSENSSNLEGRDVSKVSLFAQGSAGKPLLRLGVDERGRAMRGVVIGLGQPVDGWRVIALSPQSTIDDQAAHVRRQALLLALVLIFVMMVLSARVASWLARPLQSMAAAAAAVAVGEFRALPEPPKSAPREVTRLFHDLGRMIARLGAYTSELEAEVKSRTLDLTRANQELAGALDTIRRAEELIHEDIEQARLFQEKMLPVIESRPGVDLATAYFPLERVSGDIFDVCELGDGRLRIFLADATGHGVQASLRTVALKSAYDRVKLLHERPQELLFSLNERLVADYPGGELMCGAACLDLRLGEGQILVDYVNSGAEPLYVFSVETGARDVYASGPLLGGSHVSYPEATQFELLPGELLLVASDGLVEQMNARHERFEDRIGSVRLRASASTFLNELMAAFHDFRGNTPVRDDITLIALKAL
jgi:serine phosphatase RsbU (regulator of sigma subunit)